MSGKAFTSKIQKKVKLKKALSLTFGNIIGCLLF